MTALQDIGLDPALAALAGGLLLVLLMLALALKPLVGADRKAKKRLEEMLERHRPAADSQQQMQALLKATEQGGADRLARRLLPNQEKLKQRLERTGRTISIGRYLMLSVMCAAAGMGALAATTRLPTLLIVLAGIGCGIGLPHLAVGKLGGRRIARFNALFPDAIDLIIRGLKSGLPPSESFRAVGREMPDPIGPEFQKIADGMRVGQTPDQALWEAARRLDTPEFKFFVISLSIQRETGGNLIETLTNLSDVLRKRKQLKLKVKALSGEARASAIIIGSLPFAMFGVIRVMTPGYTAMLFADSRGLTMTAVGLIMMLLGWFVMAKMINFEH